MSAKTLRRDRKRHRHARLVAQLARQTEGLKKLEATMANLEAATARGRRLNP